MLIKPRPATSEKPSISAYEPPASHGMSPIQSPAAPSRPRPTASARILFSRSPKRPRNTATARQPTDCTDMIAPLRTSSMPR